MNLFVVDDDDDIRQLLRAQLELAGHRVSAFATGRELESDALWDDVQVAYVDWMSPEPEDGERLLGWLGANQPHVCRVLVTAAGFFQKRPRPDSPCRVVTKPWTQRDLEPGCCPHHFGRDDV